LFLCSTMSHSHVLPVRQTTRILTDVDHRCEEALHHVLRPEYHSLIPEWIRTSNAREKQGIIQLADMGEGTLLRGIGRPLVTPLGPPTERHEWYHLKSPPGKPHRMNWPVREPRDGAEELRRSASDMSLSGTRPSELGQLQWQREDAAEAALIPKPGGYVIALKDNVTLMTMKTMERNRGTYKLFGGSFDSTTTQGTSHGLRSIGMEGWRSNSYASKMGLI